MEGSVVNSRIASHRRFSEPELSFHATRSSDCSHHPLRGLLRFGPYSSGLIPEPIRIATLAPSGESSHLYKFIKSLKNEHRPKERKDYLPDWPGFHSVFGVHIEAAPRSCRLELSQKTDVDFCDAETPHVLIADNLTKAIHNLGAYRNEFDILFVYLPRRWEPAFIGGPEEDFDLHDHLKAFTARRGIPIQIVREDSAVSYPCRASVMWRIGLALYAKAGGIPWKLAETDPEVAYIGISYSLRSMGSDRPRFVTCCSQIFDSEGAGLEFIAYDTREVDVQRGNPFLSKTEMFRVMTRSMDLYRRRHAGRSPRRVMVHKTTEFKRDEVDGCMEALHLCETVDLIQVIEDVGWRGVLLSKGRSGKKGKPTPFPVSRGTIIQIAPREALLWTHGDVEDVTRGSYFQGSRSTPRPVRLVRHAGHGSWDDTARAILGLSKMNWNNDSLYDPLPVTMTYAKILSRVVKRIPNLESVPYQFRFFM